MNESAPSAVQRVSRGARPSGDRNSTRHPNEERRREERTFKKRIARRAKRANRETKGRSAAENARGTEKRVRAKAQEPQTRIEKIHIYKLFVLFCCGEASAVTSAAAAPALQGNR